MALIQNDIDWQNKLMEYKEKAHDKYVNETDIDDAAHWAHYEGAFAAFRWTLINGGSVDEELMQEYIDAVDFYNGERKEDN